MTMVADPIILTAATLSSLPANDAECRICHENFSITDDIIQLQCCRRIFHRDCYRSAVEYHIESGRGNEPFSCPQCRTEIWTQAIYVETNLEAKQVQSCESDILQYLANLAANLTTDTAISLLEYCIKRAEHETPPIQEPLHRRTLYDEAKQEDRPHLDQLFQMDGQSFNEFAWQLCFWWEFYLDEPAQQAVMDAEIKVEDWAKITTRFGVLPRTFKLSMGEPEAQGST